MSTKIDPHSPVWKELSIRARKAVRSFMEWYKKENIEDLNEDDLFPIRFCGEVTTREIMGWAKKHGIHPSDKPSCPDYKVGQDVYIPTTHQRYTDEPHIASYLKSRFILSDDTTAFLKLANGYQESFFVPLSMVFPTENAAMQAAERLVEEKKHAQEADDQELPSPR